VGLRGRLGGFYIQHGHDSGTSVELHVTLPFIGPSAMHTWIAVFQFSGKLKGVVNLIVFCAFWIFTNKTAVMIGHFRSPIFLNRAFQNDVEEANIPG
jgi:hypothetical protein